jgi:hypothetical protein
LAATTADQQQQQYSGLPENPEGSWPIGLPFPAHLAAAGEAGSLDSLQQQQQYPAGRNLPSSSGSDGGSDNGSDSSLDVNGWDMPCCAGACHKQPKGDALEVLLARLAQIRGQLAEAQTEAERDPYPAALVTFRCGCPVDMEGFGDTPFSAFKFDSLRCNLLLLSASAPMGM